MSDVERIVALLRATRRAWAQRIVPFAGGIACVDSRLPKLWDSNFLAVEDADADAATVGAEASRIKEQEGLGHRKLWVDDDGLASRLEPGLRALGWEPNVLLLLVRRREPERPPALHLVRELDLGEMEAARRSVAGTTEWVRTEDDVRQVLEAKRIKAEAGARFFGAFADGELGSVCDLYEVDRVAQIEDVVTLPQLRGRGLAGALVLHAAAAARAAGSDLVFLDAAADDDVPVRLYRRLGFDEVGRVREFNRSD